MKAPLLIPLLGLVGGILAAMAGAGLWVSLALVIAGCVFWVIMQRLSRNLVRAFRLNNLHYVWVFLLFGGVGIFTADINRPGEIQGDTNRYLAVRGHVRGIKHSTRGDVAEVDVYELIDKNGKARSVSNMLMLLHSDALRCGIDDRILVASPIKPVTDNPNRFEQGYAAYLHRQGIYYQLECPGDEVKVIGLEPTLAGYGNGVRSRLERAIEHTQLSKSTQNFLITVLLGDRAYLSEERRALFADAGISHILALSGMHVAIIAGILMWVLFPLNFAGLYHWRLVITSLLLFFYAFITGLAPSIVRATLMSATMLIALLLERKNTAWNALLLAMFVILLFSPYAIADIGLQLSFLCVASLIFFVNPLNPIDHHNHPVAYCIAAFILTSLVAVMGTWCVTAYYLGTIPITFLPANILVLPLLPLYITLSIIYLLLAGMELEPYWICRCLGRLLDGSLQGLHDALEHLTADGASVIQFTPSLWSVICWLLLMVVGAMLLTGKRSLLRKSVFAVTALAFVGVTTADAYRDVPDAMIIRNHYRDISVLRRTALGEELITLPRHTLSVSYPLDGVSVVTLDATTDSAAMAQIKAEVGDTCDYLLIASGYRGLLEDAVLQLPTRKIVLHTSLRKKRENSLLHEADSLALPIHSLRTHGPLRSDE